MSYRSPKLKSPTEDCGVGKFRWKKQELEHVELVMRLESYTVKVPSWKQAIEIIKILIKIRVIKSFPTSVSTFQLITNCFPSIV